MIASSNDAGAAAANARSGGSGGSGRSSSPVGFKIGSHDAGAGLFPNGMDMMASDSSSASSYFASSSSSTAAAALSKPAPRKRALTDSADEREALARGNIDFSVSPGVDVSGGGSLGGGIRNSGGMSMVSTSANTDMHDEKQKSNSDSTKSLPPKMTTVTRRRSTSAMTADNLDEAQSEKLRSVMRAIMVMRIKEADSDPVEIIPGLFIGSIGAALNKDGLLAVGITHVLCAAGGIKLYFPETFTYKQVIIGDKINSDMYSHLPGCCNFIGKALKPGGKVLVHCFAGQSRSATVIAAYLMLTQKLNLEAAVSLMRSKRKQVQPNPGFCAQLLKWGKYIASLSQNGQPQHSQKPQQQLSRASGSAVSAGNHGYGRSRGRRASSPLAHEIPIGDIAATVQ